MSSSQLNEWSVLPTSKYDVVSAHWKNETLILGVRNPDFVGLISVELGPNAPNEPTILAGNAPGYRDAPLQVAQFVDPVSICQSVNNTLLVADAGCHVIRTVDANQVSTFLGTGQAGYQDGTSNVSFTHPNLVSQTETHVIVQDGDRNGALRVYDLKTRTMRTVNSPQQISRAFPVGAESFGLVSSGYVHLLSFVGDEGFPQFAPFFVTPTPLEDAFKSRNASVFFYLKNSKVYSYNSDTESISALAPIGNVRNVISLHSNMNGRLVSITSNGVFLHTPYRAPSHDNVGYAPGFTSGNSSPFGTTVPPQMSSQPTMSPSASYGSFPPTQGSSTPPPGGLAQPGYVGVGSRTNSGSGIPSGPGNMPSGFSSPQQAPSGFGQSQNQPMATNYNQQPPSGYPPSGSPQGIPQGYQSTSNNFNNGGRPQSGQYGPQQGTPSGYPPTSTATPPTPALFDTPSSQPSPFGTPTRGGSGGFDLPPSGYPPTPVSGSFPTGTSSPGFPPTNTAVPSGFPPTAGFPPQQPNFQFPPQSPGSPQIAMQTMQPMQPMQTQVLPMQTQVVTAMPMSPMAQLHISPAYTTPPPNATIVQTTVVQHGPPSASGIFWEWESDLVNHKFSRFDASVSDAIDAAYQNGDKKAYVNIRGAQYVVELNTAAPRQFLVSDKSKSRRIKAPHGYVLPFPQ